MMALPMLAVVAMLIAQVWALAQFVVMVSFVPSWRRVMTASPMLAVLVTRTVLPLVRGLPAATAEICPELEACDDGFADACGSCNSDCSGAGTGATCGDGDFCPELEACDDGFTDACGTCNADCSGLLE